MPEEDLGTLLGRILRRIIASERPLLAAHDISMWGYVVLAELAYAEADSQLALAERMGYDKTRLIALLDQLEADGMISRAHHPADRRARVLGLTKKGAVLQQRVHAEIRAMEEELLGDLSSGERERLRSTLSSLAPRPG